MENTTVADIIAWCDGQYHGPQQLLYAPLSDIVTDSREAAAGMLFAAIPGQQVDGHDYAAAALAQGALCCLAQRPLAAEPYILVPDTGRALGAIAKAYRHMLGTRLLAVTGSVGKTTAKEMLASVLGRRWLLHKNSGNFNNALGLPLTLFRLNSTHQLAVTELGISDFGEMELLADIARPDLAFYTNIGDAHLEYLGDRAGVLQAKSELLDYLPPGGRVYLNGDDDWLRRMRRPPGLQQRWYGLQEGNDLQALDIRDTEQGCAARLRGEMELDIELMAPGRYLLYAATGAALVGLDMGLAAAEIAAGIAAFQPLPGRGNLLSAHDIRVIDHSYNANPSSMLAALQALTALPGRSVAVLGDMYELGAASPQLHRQVGENAAALGVSVLLSAGSLADQITAAAAVANSDILTRHFATLDDLLAALPAILRPGDAVLVKASRSAHFEQVVKLIVES